MLDPTIKTLNNYTITGMCVAGCGGVDNGCPNFITSEARSQTPEPGTLELIKVLSDVFKRPEVWRICDSDSEPSETSPAIQLLSGGF